MRKTYAELLARAAQSDSGINDALRDAIYEVLVSPAERQRLESTRNAARAKYEFLIDATLQENPSKVSEDRR